MDRNSFIGLVLIGAILVMFSIYSSPSKEEIAQNQIRRDSVESVQNLLNQSLAEEKLSQIQSKSNDSTIELLSTLKDSVATIQQDQLFGEFSNASVGEEKLMTIETDEFILNFSNKGGRIASVELKNYSKWDSTSLLLFEQERSVFNLNFFTNSNKNILTDELYLFPMGEKKN